MKTYLALAFSLVTASALFAADVKPLKVLLITGGCCHDYAKQKEILKKGIEERTNAVVDIIYASEGEKNADGKQNMEKPLLPIYGNPEYAKGYDAVIHDECAAGIIDPAIIAGVLKPHIEDGIPAVNLHCAMHCYRFGNFRKPVAVGADNGHWYEYLGLHSTGHGPQKPVAITFQDPTHPITKGMADWTTINEELYNNIHVYEGTKALARGKQDAGDKPGQNDSVLVWTNEAGPKKTRVFSTSLGHNNATVEDPRYLDLVTRGVLWATGKLGADGKVVAGYEAKAAK